MGAMVLVFVFSKSSFLVFCLDLAIRLHTVVFRIYSRLRSFLSSYAKRYDVHCVSVDIFLSVFVNRAHADENAVTLHSVHGVFVDI